MTDASKEVPAVIVKFTGAATIRQAEDIADRLGRALAQSDPVLLDCDELQEVDFAFLQMVVAAKKQAANQGKSLGLTAPARGALLEALMICGVENGPRRDFWLHQQGSAV